MKIGMPRKSKINFIDFFENEMNMEVLELFFGGFVCGCLSFEFNKLNIKPLFNRGNRRL